VTECGDGLEFIGGCFLDTQDGRHLIKCRGNYPVGGGDGGDGHGVMLESERVGEAFAASAIHDGANTVVVLEGWPYVPAVGGVVGPGFASCRLEVDKHFRSRWGHGGGVKREQSLGDSDDRDEAC
jgi:hypothetical protein